MRRLVSGLSSIAFAVAALLAGHVWLTDAAQGASTATSAPAAVTKDEGSEGETPPEFTEAYLADPANIETGRTLWEDLCRHCHGRSAYPGKAPKLKPRKYTPEFVFDRVTNGFRKMPGWGEAYSKEERMAVVAYVKSKEFSP